MKLPRSIPLPRALGLLHRFPAKAWFAVLYFALIPLYAWGYDHLPGEFYHANVQREPMVQEDERHISGELERAIVSTFNDHHTTSVVIGNWNMDSDTFKVLFLKATTTEGDVEIGFKLDMKLIDNAHQQTLFLDPAVTFLAKEGFEERSGHDAVVDDSERVRYKTVNVKVPVVPFWNKEDNPLFAKAMFPTGGVALTPNNGGNASPKEGSVSVIMPISKRLDVEIRNLANGIQGDPSNLSGHFDRMLYLSAVTITTLGYGDISPLTTRARLLIVSEAVAGLLTIGLFLNALSRGNA